MKDKYPLEVNYPDLEYFDSNSILLLNIVVRKKYEYQNITSAPVLNSQIYNIMVISVLHQNTFILFIRKNRGSLDDYVMKRKYKISIHKLIYFI